MSALPSIADIRRYRWDVRKVPKADVGLGVRFGCSLARLLLSSASDAHNHSRVDNHTRNSHRADNKVYSRSGRVCSNGGGSSSRPSRLACPRQRNDPTRGAWRRFASRSSTMIPATFASASEMRLHPCDQRSVCAAIMLMSGTAVSDVYVQSTGGGARGAHCRSTSLIASKVGCICFQIDRDQNDFGTHPPVASWRAKFLVSCTSARRRIPPAVRPID
jgi:hypothetical protein